MFCSVLIEYYICTDIVKRGFGIDGNSFYSNAEFFCGVCMFRIKSQDLKKMY